MATPAKALVASTSLSVAPPFEVPLPLENLPPGVLVAAAVGQSLTKFGIPSRMVEPCPLEAKVDVRVGLDGVGALSYATFIPRDRKRPKRGQLWPRTR